MEDGFPFFETPIGGIDRYGESIHLVHEPIAPDVNEDAGRQPDLMGNVSENEVVHGCVCVRSTPVERTTPAGSRNRKVSATGGTASFGDGAFTPASVR